MCTGMGLQFVLHKASTVAVWRQGWIAGCRVQQVQQVQQMQHCAVPGLDAF